MAEQEQPKRVVIATRSSPLAMVQTEWVAAELRREIPGIEVVIQKMETQGDRVLDKPLAKIGDKGLFTAELEACILDGRVDFAVHSLKDLPTQLPEGLCLGAITEREPKGDALVLHEKHRGKSLKELPKGSVIGTSSLRRIAQLKRRYPHLSVKDVRGNLNTRLRKLDSGDYDALILAEAGLTRMNFHDRMSAQLVDEFFYAVGQGALGIECRSSDKRLMDTVLSKIHHKATAACCLAERAFMRTLEGGCQVPIGVRSHLDADKNVVSLEGCVLSLDGAKCIEGKASGSVDPDPAAIGVELAGKLSEQGARDVLKSIRSD